MKHFTRNGDLSSSNRAYSISPRVPATPKDVVSKINASINRALAIEEVRRRLNAQGFEPAPATPEEFGAFLASEVRKYARIIRETGVRID